MEDGSVVHGPASIPQAAYDVRVRDGRIEVRHRA
jgi:nitrite reductase/ring-hydroxylating ferredoxin subunit